MNNIEVGTRVKLPFNETGTVVKIRDIIWGCKYIVRIRKAVFNKTNQRHDFKLEQLTIDV